MRELIAAVGDAATFSVAGRSGVLQQGYDNSAYSLVLPSCCGRVAAYCSMIGALHFRRGRRFARAASSLLLLLLAYGACFAFGRVTMLGRVHRTRQHLVLESPSGSSTSLSSMLHWFHRRRRPRATSSPGFDLQCPTAVPASCARLLSCSTCCACLCIEP